jgi:hypothetical protein
VSAKAAPASTPRARAATAGSSAPGNLSPSNAAAAATSASANPASTLFAAAQDILRAIEAAGRARNGAGPGPDSRLATRYCYCVPMTLHIDDPRSAATRIIRAATSNISTGGFAFIFDAAVSLGSTIRAQFDSLPGKPQIAGIVRSCVHICGTQHRIGVEYQ